MPSPILLLGPSTDPQLNAIRGHIEALGGRPVWVDTRSSPLPLVWSLEDGARVHGERPQSAFVRSLPPRQPLLAAIARGDASGVDLDALRAGQVTGNAARDLVCAVLEDLARAGHTVLNPPRHGSLLEHKPTQLHHASIAGLHVPKTTAVASPEAAADAFVGVNDRDLVHKPIRGGDIAREGRPTKAGGVLLQERIRGDDVRVLLLDGQLLAAYSIAGLSTLDPREDPKWARGDFTYRTVDLTPHRGLVQALAGLASTLSLRVCGIDLKHTDTGDWVFLEVNGAPVWLEAERRLGLDISERVASVLVNSPPQPPRQRP